MICTEFQCSIEESQLRAQRMKDEKEMEREDAAHCRGFSRISL